MASSGLRTSSTSETSISRHSGGGRSRRGPAAPASRARRGRAGARRRSPTPRGPGGPPRATSGPAGRRRAASTARGARRARSRRRGRRSRPRSRRPASRRQRRSDSRPTMAPVSHSTTGCQYSSSSPCTRARRSARLLRLPLGGEGARARGVHVPRVAALLLGPLHRARVALCRSDSVSGPSSGKSAIPMLAVTRRSWPPMLKGLRRARRSLSAITVTSSSRLMPGRRMVNTSPGDAGDRVALAQRALEGEGHAAQEVVAVAAAEPLVDLREAVEAELDDGELLAVALGVDDRHRRGGRRSGGRSRAR